MPFLRRLAVVLSSLLIPLAFCAGEMARAQESAVVAALSSPLGGGQLFGPVNITGSALHPTAFDRYTLEYDLLSEVAEQWFPVQEQVTQQVQNGVLGTWDTSTVPDGLYQLRLRVYLDDGTFGETIVSNLRVQNSQPTPVPTTGPAGVAPGAAQATAGPTPTSPVVQPPSSNPAPDLAVDPGADSLDDTASEPSLLQGESSSASINFERVRQAFCTGGLLALAAFAALVVYWAVRRLVRGRPPREYAGDDY